jgi:hypothetical protein
MSDAGIGRLYKIRNLTGGFMAAKGDWVVEGPGIETLHFGEDRVRAATVARALNLAYVEGTLAHEPKAC